MRHIYYMVLIILCLSDAIGLRLMQTKTPQSNAALVIDGRTISSEEFKKLYF